MDNTDKIISLVSKKGPVLPAHISKEIGTDIIIASAHLSELVSRNKLVISSSKIGGSPLYYLKGQESKLEEMIRPHLNDKDLFVLDLLKENKVLVDTELDPLTRVALKGLKDFAVPIYVTHGAEKELFWKWYALDNETINQMITNILQQRNPQPEPDEKEEIIPEPTIKDKKPLVKEETKKIIKTLPSLKTEIKKQDLQKPELKPITKVKKETKPKTEPRAQTEQQTLTESKPTKDAKSDSFFQELETYFSQKGIEVLESNLIKKSAEIDIILNIPSAVGKLKYFCKAKNKKSVSDSDLNAAFIQGQLRKLPSMLLSFGEPNKKAKELLNTELFKGFVIEKIRQE